MIRWVLCDAKLNTARESHGAAVHNGRIFVVGGHDGNNKLKTVERLDGDSWTLLKESMNTEIEGVSVVECGGALFALGGLSNGGCENSIEILNEVKLMTVI